MKKCLLLLALPLVLSGCGAAQGDSPANPAEPAPTTQAAEPVPTATPVDAAPLVGRWEAVGDGLIYELVLNEDGTATAMAGWYLSEVAGTAKGTWQAVAFDGAAYTLEMTMTVDFLYGSVPDGIPDVGTVTAVLEGSTLSLQLPEDSELTALTSDLLYERR